MMRNLEYLAQIEQRYRETALYPARARDAHQLRDHALAHQASARRDRADAPGGRVGRGLLASLRARFGGRRNGVTTAARP